MRFIDAAATARHLAFTPLIAALRHRFTVGCEVPLRHTHPIVEPAHPDHPAGTVLLMPAWRPGGRFGLMTVTIFAANRALGRPAWLQPGTHVDLIGSFKPDMRVSDETCFARSRVYCDTPEAMAAAELVFDALQESP